MRKYGQIQSSFWTDPEVSEWDAETKLLATYLLTCPHANGIGCYRLPFGYIEADLKYPSETVSKRFGILSTNGFLRYCKRSGIAFLPNFLKFNPIANGNVAKARQSEFESIPEKFEYINELKNSLLEFGDFWTPHFRNRLETVSKRYGKQEPIRSDPDPVLTRTDPEPDPCTDQEGDLSTKPRSDPIPDLPKSEKSLSARKKGNGTLREPPVTGPVWDAYRTAFEVRYHVPPDDNAKTRSQLAQLVKRVGANNAPGVAGHYVRHNAALYVRAAHSVDLLLRDCEKLSMEYRTGRQITDSEARASDRRQGTAGALDEVLRDET